MVQKGLAAAHIGHAELAYECVDWLSNSYWSPAFTSYHDPGKIFNVDICGGLPSLVSEMILQSSTEEILLLPALPKEWKTGSVKGLRARGGFELDFEWRDGKIVNLKVKSLLGNTSTLKLNDEIIKIDLPKGNSKNWSL